jgi:hypothetical protein
MLIPAAGLHPVQGDGTHRLDGLVTDEPRQQQHQQYADNEYGEPLSGHKEPLERKRTSQAPSVFPGVALKKKRARLARAVDRPKKAACSLSAVSPYGRTQPSIRGNEGHPVMAIAAPQGTGLSGMKWKKAPDRPEQVELPGANSYLRYRKSGKRPKRYDA